MNQSKSGPLPPSKVADAVTGNWVDRLAPLPLRPYLRLMRLDRPIGTWLLLFPCWWAVLLATIQTGSARVDLWLLFLFAAGAIVMRGAGCTYNDYVDRDYDASVARTASRPIPSGQVSPNSAIGLVVVLGLIGLAVLVQLNLPTILLGISSLALVLVYPFMKRVTNWPQIVLGLAFNWGALVGWTAVTGSLAAVPLALYAGAVFWTIGYDTIYAHQDADDDAMLGLGSTALRFGETSPRWITTFYAGALIMWALAGWLVGAQIAFVAALVAIAVHFAWQITTLDIRDGANCLKRFRSNREVGLILLLGLLADVVLA